jgi:hypothetical protein
LLIAIEDEARSACCHPSQDGLRPYRRKRSHLAAIDPTIGTAFAVAPFRKRF